MKSPILPRTNASEVEALLEGAVPVGRFIEWGCADTGGVDPKYSYDLSGTLYKLKVRSITESGFLASPRHEARRRDLDRGLYRTNQFASSESELRSMCLRDLFGKIPKDEKGKFKAFEFLYLGQGMTEIRLY